MSEDILTYRSLNGYLRERFGKKLYKLALDGGFSCPNRDGTLGKRGCSFCLEGSGSFSSPLGKLSPEDPEEAYREAVFTAIESAKARVEKKQKEPAYIAYFQRYTGTYAPYRKLEKLYTAALSHPETEVLSIATRPDCLPEKTISLLSSLNRKKPVWVELGLQTIHEETAERIRRGYPLPVYDDAVKRLKEAGIYVITHMIIGLPGETREMMRETASYIGHSGADGIKLQLLNVLRGTDLAAEYLQDPFPLPTLPEYVSILKDLVKALPPDMTIHRLTGDGAKKDLIAPLWAADKKRVLNTVRKSLHEQA